MSGQPAQPDPYGAASGTNTALSNSRSAGAHLPTVEAPVYDELEADTAQTVMDLNAKIREAITLGKPAEVADYAVALRDTAVAYDVLTHPGSTDD